ncbi:MAG: D-alanyl-D-alanine carboxypeptidase, partial [Oscillospiraceae bacterium]|nr:D-alanyl-D-alanine carboxypeptidase [Oscillospiraceae bacterium]
MKKIKFLPLFLILVIMTSIFLAPSALALEEPALSCPTVLVLDRDTGEVLLERNADSKVYPASITKIMTVLLAVEAIENGDAFITDEVTASANVTFDLVADGSSAGIMVGETMTLESLLYAAMLSSANEACNIIAEHIGGSIPDFVDMMNERALELGCEATHFVNTHGLPDDNHYTTARDLAAITCYALNNPTFAKIVATKRITFGERTFINKNKMLFS